MKFDKKKISEKIKGASKKASNVLGARQTKFGSNTLVLILALLGILILVNYIVRKESGTLRYDMTKNKQFTLSDQTKKVLQNVNDDVNITIFYQTDNPSRAQLQNLLSEYQAKNSRIKFEFVDPDKNPTKAREFGITRYGTIIFKKGDKTEQTTGFSESDITSSILKLSKDGKKVVYFMIGHKEKDLSLTSEKGYSSIKNTLEKENFEIKNLNLTTVSKVPDDASVVILAGPQKALLDKEKESLKKYLDEKDGKLFALIDPRKEIKEDVKVNDLLNNYGINLTDGLVIDPTKAFFGDVAAPVVEKWESHQITEGLSAAFFPGVQMVSKGDKTPENILVNDLGKSSNDSWLENNLDTEKVKYDAGSDKKGPISIGTAAHQTKKVKEGDQEVAKEGLRIVVIGDSDFAVNGYETFLGNQDLFVNSLHWLASEEELISIRPKEEEQRTVALTGSQGRIIFYLTVVIMPLTAIGVGIYVWSRRRKTRRQ
ncbi:MAG: Gldg family protein [Patescibacteria group bacterium]|jgi:ABC-type uncharacterized transport system involved in gliding motility auxiliary subunit